MYHIHICELTVIYYLINYYFINDMNDTPWERKCLLKSVSKVSLSLINN